MSKAVQLFNDLPNRTTEKKLKKILIVGKDEGQTALVQRIAAALKQAEQCQGKSSFVIDRMAVEQIPNITLPSQKEPLTKNVAQLNAAWHEGIAKEALDQCGRLIKGYKYEKGGEIVKVDPITKKEEHALDEDCQRCTVKEKNQLEKYREKHELVEKKIEKYEKRNEEISELRRNADYKEAGKYYEEKYENAKKIELLKRQQLHYANIIVALVRGGGVLSITDKKGKKHDEIADFRNIDVSNIIFDEDKILEQTPPYYIPMLDQKTLERKGFVFDAIKIDKDSYLLSTSSYKKDDENFFIALSLDQIVLTSDYYLSLTKAIYKNAAQDATKRAEERWNSLDDSKKEQFYNQTAQQAVYNEMPKKVQKTITFEKWTKLPWQEKEKVYKFYKRHGSKRIKTKLEDNKMWTSLHEMYERFIDPKATQPKPRYAHPKVFAYWREFREFMKFKILDINIQRQDLSEGRKKGMQTSYGNTNIDNALLKSHGIKIKRQNGTQIKPEQKQQIDDAWLSIEKVYGPLSKIAKEYGLTISHAGKKFMYARKSIGVFNPNYNAIGVTNKYGKEAFNSTLAHELAHLLDYLLGNTKGRRYASDNFESTAGILAREFRSNMNGETKSDYLNSTKECLARALEQHYAYQTYGEKAPLFYIELNGVADAAYYHNSKPYVNYNIYQEKIKPLVKKFLKEFQDFAKKAKGLNAPRHEGIAREALTDCGRLKPGYKYLKGGKIVKIDTTEKKPKSKPKAAKQTTKSKKPQAVKTTGKKFPLIVGFPIDQINIDTKRFQNRTKLNENTVNQIVENFNDTQFDPVVLWTDPKNGKVYLLAGHHRLEAYKRRNEENIPAKFADKDYPTEKEAIKYARQLSNANRTLETPLERAKIYREMRLNNEPAKKIEKEATIEGKNKNYILNLAALNDSGQVAEALTRLANSPDKQNEKALEKMADWIGEARRKYPQLTNAHETEMFKFLSDASASKRINTKAEFLQKIYAIAGAFDFDSEKPLNLKRIKYKSEGEKTYDRDLAEMKQNISDKQETINTINARFTDPERKDYVNPDAKDFDKVKQRADAKIADLNTEIKRIQRRMLEHQKNKGKYTRAGSNQAALFGPTSKKPLNGSTTPNITGGGNASTGGSTRRHHSVKKPARILKAGDVSNIEFSTLEFSDGWEKLLQDPATNMRLAIWGKPKNGKTAGACKFASYLTKFGTVLYNFADQGINSSTKKLLSISGLDTKDNAYISTSSNLKELQEDIETTRPDFVFIDMINDHINNTGVKYHEFKEQFFKRYPEVSFILVFEVTKEGNFKGDQGWTHIVDGIITVEDFIMESKGRYGMGEFVVWDEGAKKYNPKRYNTIKNIDPGKQPNEPATDSKAQTPKLKYSFEVE